MDEDIDDDADNNDDDELPKKCVMGLEVYRYLFIYQVRGWRQGVK